MGQIVKRKKKGRPSKADLAKRNNSAPEKTAPGREPRRSLRRRNVRYTFDFDNYLEDDELFEDFDEDEDERRREKKHKLLLKLQTSKDSTNTHSESTQSRTRRVSHAPTASESSSDYGVDGGKPSKKARLDGDDAEEEENNDGDDDVNENIDDDEVGNGGKAERKEMDSPPGTPFESRLTGLPLPDKKILEIILDKLQKKDIYGVYAEPVDPEELPDYHDVIEHPMDFATVRKKLGNGSYTTFEQFESDVCLICSNAMQYNAPDTIYYKQALSIQELAKEKFHKVRIGIKRSEELKSDQKTKLCSAVKEPMKKPMSWTLQEAVGSDFASGATLATMAGYQIGSGAAQVGGSERASSVEKLVEPSLIENNVDRAEESLPGKRPLSKIERKPPFNDDNRRATYNLSTQPVATSESIFTTFDGESKQLVPVGLYMDHSYARSLARFAATLAPAAWKIASQRIEHVLPSESKFGRGWVGEYEPLPTPLLLLEKCNLKEPAFFRKAEQTVVNGKDKAPINSNSLKETSIIKLNSDKFSRTTLSSNKNLVNGPNLERKSPFTGPAVIRPTATSISSFSVPAKDQPIKGPGLDGRPLFASPGTKATFSASPSQQQQPTSQSRNFIEPDKKVLKHMELNCPSSASQNSAAFVAERQNLNTSEMPPPRSAEMVPKNKNMLPSGSSKQPNINRVVTGLPNGKVNGLDSSRMTTDRTKAATYFPHGQEQGLTDPAQLMKMLAEKAKSQQKSANESPANSNSIRSPSPSMRREDSNSAAAAAARAWMSIGAGGFRPAGENITPHKNQISADSLYNPVRDFQSQVSQFRGEQPSLHPMHFQPEKNSFPFHPLVPQHTRMGNDAQFQNQHMIFPHVVTADLSRFQVQSPWQSLSPQMQLRQKQESLPPDLNISFQASGSPGRPASGVLVDSQQPDLALQL